MFTTNLKAVLTQALRVTFDDQYPEEDFRDLHASIEYPTAKQDYPGIWVDFDISNFVQTAGIGHTEYVIISNPETNKDETHLTTRWSFEGLATYTVVALTSLERDRLFDEVVKVMAFGSHQPQSSRANFRNYLESNGLIAFQVDFDQLRAGRFAVAPGTPWGTDEHIYEATVSFEAIGEFVADPESGALYDLEAVEVHPYTEEEGDPFEGDEAGWV